MKLYIYGLAEAGLVTIPDTLCGLTGAAVRLESVGPVDAIVTEFSGNTLKTDRENILAHERVLDAVLAVATPLPFRFGTVVTVEKLAAFVRENEGPIEADLKRVRGLVQMTARIVRKDARSQTAPSGEGPGTRFLRERQAKKEELAGAASWLTEAMGDIILGSESSIGSSRPAMATVAHLIRKGDIEAYTARFDAVCRTRKDLSCLRSGPWPPYGFVLTGKNSQVDP